MINHDITYLFHFNRPFEILNVFVLRSWHDILQNNLEREYKSLTSCVCCTSMNVFLLPWSFSSISSLNAWYLHSIQKGKRQWNIFYCIFNINSYWNLNLWLLTTTGLYCYIILKFSSRYDSKCIILLTENYYVTNYYLLWHTKTKIFVVWIMLSRLYINLYFNHACLCVKNESSVCDKRNLR